MAKVTLRLYKVPPEFSKQAHNVENICQHFYRRVANGETIPNEEIGGIGCLGNRPDDDYSGVLCLDCEKLLAKTGVRFEIVPWPVQGVPIKEFALSKDAVKK